MRFLDIFVAFEEDDNQMCACTFSIPTHTASATSMATHSLAVLVQRPLTSTALWCLMVACMNKGAPKIGPKIL